MVSPFLDKQHGTERCVAEQVQRLACDYEVHVYSNRLEDIDLSCVVWHRVPALPGPHLFAYCWWFLANHLWRWWDRSFRGLRFDVTYAPGINCLDADLISVHCVFSELYGQVKDRLSLGRNPISSWGRLVHRRAHYRLIMQFERLIYGRQRSLLTAVSRKTAGDLKRYGRDPVPVIYHGLNAKRFNPEIRLRLREQSRKALDIPESAFCLLLVGNGWENKGLASLLEALAFMGRRDWLLLVVGQDDPGPYRHAIAQNRVEQQVVFLPPRPDVEFYYASADAYVGPSLEDAFGLPPLEAMACGLPVIVSNRAGVSEVITDTVDGFLLKDPKDVASLAKLISALQNNPALRQSLGDNAARTAREYTWERNAAQLSAIFEHAIKRLGYQNSSPISDQ